MRLRNGLAALAAFQAAVTRLNPNGSGVEDLNRPAAAITSAIHPQAVGWRVLAALAGLAGIADRQTFRALLQQVAVHAATALDPAAPDGAAPDACTEPAGNC